MQELNLTDKEKKIFAIAQIMLLLDELKALNLLLNSKIDNNLRHLAFNRKNEICRILEI